MAVLTEYSTQGAFNRCKFHFQTNRVTVLQLSCLDAYFKSRHSYVHIRFLLLYFTEGTEDVKERSFESPWKRDAHITSQKAFTRFLRVQILETRMSFWGCLENYYCYYC